MQTRSDREDPFAGDEGAQAEVDLALSRAALYGALALGFRPPTDETLERLIDENAAAALADAARFFEKRTGETGLAGRALALSGSDGSLDQLVASHRRLYGHTARGEVPCYETEYGAEALFQQPQELGDLAGFLRAFGLVLDPQAHERVDHVSCECEFLYFLASKEAYAIAAGDDEMRAATVEATRLFLRDHLGRFTPVFGRRLVRADGGGFYSRLGQLLLGFVEADCRRLGMPTGPESLGLRPDPATCTAPMGCEASCGILEGDR